MLKKLFTVIVLFSLLFVFTGCCSSHNPSGPDEVWVDGYTRSDGTKVAGHYRTKSNNTQKDNWSSKPNRNPHTGAKGYKIPKY